MPGIHSFDRDKPQDLIKTEDTKKSNQLKTFPFFLFLQSSQDEKSLFLELKDLFKKPD
jgi:hypothetical protein